MKKYIQIISSIFIISLPFLSIEAQTYARYVGESVDLKVDIPSGSLFGSAAWTPSNSSCLLPRPSSGSLTTTVYYEKYFSGTSSVVCRYAYRDRATNKNQSGNKTFWLSCIPIYIKLNAAELVLAPGDGYPLKVSQSPEDAPNAIIKWESSAKSIVTVDDNGNIQANLEGEAIITAKNLSGPENSYPTCKVIVKREPSNNDLTIQAKSYTREYGDENPSFEYEVTTGTITSGTPTITCSATKTSPVGTYDIVINEGSVSNGTVNLINGTLTITKAPLSISAGDYTKQVGEDNPEFTPSFSGFKNNETNSVLTKQPTITTTATSSSPAGTYPVTVGGAEARNYNISYIDGMLTVTAKPSADDIEINEINFPDANFRNYLLEYFGLDGKLTEDEINNITTLYLSFQEGWEISSLRGIEVFKNLQRLYVSRQKLTSLDISKNTKLSTLDCSSNQLKSLDVTKNTALTKLYCYSNKLTSLDVTKNTALTALWCSDNQLKSLDVTKNTALTTLWCSNNQLTLLDVTKNTALTALWCSDNQLKSLDVTKNTALTKLECYCTQLTSLDVTKNIDLTELNCYGNLLSSLDVSNNFQLIGLHCANNQLASLDVSKNTALRKLSCYENKLTSLDVTRNKALTTLWCSNNQLTSLDVSENATLGDLSCSNNQLTSLDVSENATLGDLSCSNNQLTSLDVTKNTALTSLKCSDNQLTVMDVTRNTALTTLWCFKNQLTSLDIQNNTALIDLYCYANKLISLDVSRNPSLSILSCYNNQLTSLDVSKNTALTNLNCHNNKIKGTEMEVLVYSLPINNTSNDHPFRVYRSQSAIEGNVITSSHINIAKSKGWTPLYYDGSEWKEYEGIPGPIFVTKIILNKTKETIGVGNNLQLEITDIIPSNATDKSVAWSSNKPNIASVDGNGFVKANAVGTATITCKAQDGSEVTEKCIITVVPNVTPVEDIVLKTPSKTLEVGETVTLKAGEELQFTAIVKPDDATEKSVSWSSSKENVASIDAYGRVMAMADGLAQITCTANDGSGVTETCLINVEAVPVTKITLNNSGLSDIETDMELQETLQLIATIEPGNATDKSVSWESNKPFVASVDANGFVTANASGLALITCKANDGSGVEATCRINITAPEPIKIEVIPSTLPLDIGETFTLTYVLTPSNAVTTVTWSSDDETIATVTQDGAVTRLTKGKTCINAVTANGKMGYCLLDGDGIDDIKRTDGAKQPKAIYSVTGQRLVVPRKGINIVDGKKVIVK